MERACDDCGKVGEMISMTSPLGLTVWNHYHPEDQREALWFCDLQCVWNSGQRWSTRYVTDRGTAKGRG